MYFLMLGCFPQLPFLFWFQEHFVHIQQLCMTVLSKWVGCAFDASVVWLGKSKEPMCCWLVALAACKTQFIIGMAGQSVKPNSVLA